MKKFHPRFAILPAPQAELWGELAPARDLGFVLFTAAQPSRCAWVTDDHGNALANATQITSGVPVPGRVGVR